MDNYDGAPSYWRTRDAVTDLDFLPSQPSTMAISSQFDVETCLARIRRDKASVIRAAFNAGAFCVVEATRSTENNDVGDDPMDAVHECTLLQDWKRLEALRIMALERARENKDNKAKPGPVPVPAPSTVVSSSSTAVTTRTETPMYSEPAAPKRGTPNTKTATIAGGNSDARALISRAVLCSAASIVFDALTPGPHLDPLEVPQQNQAINMGAVALQAQTLGNRAAMLAKNAARRSQQRQEYRKDNAASQSPSSVFDVENPFAWRDVALDDTLIPPTTPYNPNPISLTEAWTNICRPRMQQVMESGHAVFYDADWKSRHGRMTDLLQSRANASGQYGPHLIVTTAPNVPLFAQEMEAVESHVCLGAKLASSKLRVLSYVGSPAQRRKLRKHWSKAHGLTTSSFHVLVTSYSSFLEDYLHFCQQSWQVAMLDDGYALLAAAQSDPNSQLGQLWEQGIFSCNDQHIGIAGTSHQGEWDFMSQDNDIKTACIGLTARHRLLTTCHMWSKQKDPRNLIPEPGLLRYLMPNFVDVVKEEWDRSKVIQDVPSVEYLRTLMARSVVVHCQENNEEDNMLDLAILAMCGELPPESRFEDDVPVPTMIPDETFVTDGKISQSRRLALAWLGATELSWLRYEIGSTSFKDIIDAMKLSTTHGHICEEILTASSTTSSGVGGAVTGTLAYRFAVRCCRSFGSEQGLRQHQAAQHSPPGTWLCRTCGSDCGTSQARTHHERSCGQPVGTVDAGTPPEGGGKGSKTKQHGPVGVVGKKAKGCKTAAVPKDKDPDGSFRVPGYRGVWVNPAGKHFIKLSGKPLTEDDSEEVVFYDNVELAAHMHDDVIKAGGGDEKELNFKPDGTRVPHEDKNTVAAAAGRGVEMLGTGSSSVVPALSVINIKDLPKHVKPLLRDPRQTSRTGGNSKRHVYAYRGVCRQARKGHDRWQSQISFNGCNHYLGTFDSEWDAAAVYAWAHLILYGEEATKKAQQEGEEAAAAYEKEKDALVAGEVLPPPPKAEKKKPATKKGGPPGRKKKQDGEAGVKRTINENISPGEKKVKTHTRPDLVTLAKSVSRAAVLGPRPGFEMKSDKEMAQMVAERLAAVRSIGYCVSYLGVPVEVEMAIRACVPVGEHLSEAPSGGAMLLGLSPVLFGWNVETFASMCDFESQEHEMMAVTSLSAEYESDGYNETFRTVLQGASCVIGRASKALEKSCQSLGIGALPPGGPVGKLDCHIGGVAESCTEYAATIQHLPSQVSDFQFRAGACSEDVVTLNGKRITSDMGSFPLFNEDVCTVGARVFVFLLPSDT